MVEEFIFGKKLSFLLFECRFESKSLRFSCRNLKTSRFVLKFRGAFFFGESKIPFRDYSRRYLGFEVLKRRRVLWPEESRQTGAGISRATRGVPGLSKKKKKAGLRDIQGGIYH